MGKHRPNSGRLIRASEGCQNLSVPGNPVQVRCGPGFQPAEGDEGSSKGRLAEFILKFFLQTIQCSDGAEGAAFAQRPEREQVRTRVSRINPALQQGFGFERGDAVAETAASRGEGLGQLRGFDRPRRLEEERGQNKSFEEADLVGGKDA